MILTAHTDIALPQDQVFAIVSDTAQVEAAAAKRSIDVVRTVEKDPLVPGAEWAATLVYRGKFRTINVTLTALDGPEHLAFETVSDGLSAPTSLNLVALTPTMTRLTIDVELKASTLTGRLLVQSLKLAKGTAEKKFQARFDGVGKMIEAQGGTMA